MNLITHTPQANPPELGRGGLMADAMGLGKTLTMLALIAATKADVPTDFSNATLIGLSYYFLIGEYTLLISPSRSCFRNVQLEVSN